MTHDPKSPRGFTLVELLVVMAVLSVVMVLTSVLSRHAIDLRSHTKARIVANRTAASFLRQFEADLSQRITRNETPLRIEKRQGNDEITLLTHRTGYALLNPNANRRASLVSYRIENHNLQRAASGYAFGDPTTPPNDAAGTLSLVSIPADGPELTNTRSFQTIAPSLLRLELSFLVTENGTTQPRATPPADQDLIKAIIATTVTLDPDRTRALNSNDLRTIADAFQDARDGQSPVMDWQETANTLPSKLPRIPRIATQAVQVHEGIIPLPNRRLQP